MAKLGKRSEFRNISRGRGVQSARSSQKLRLAALRSLKLYCRVCEFSQNLQLHRKVHLKRLQLSGVQNPLRVRSANITERPRPRSVLTRQRAGSNISPTTVFHKVYFWCRTAVLMYTQHFFNIFYGHQSQFLHFLV